jgi:hypothetical protein
LEIFGNTPMKNKPHKLYDRYPEYPPLAASGQGGHSPSSEVNPT